MRNKTYVCRPHDHATSISSSYLMGGATILGENSGGSEADIGIIICLTCLNREAC